MLLESILAAAAAAEHERDGIAVRSELVNLGAPGPPSGSAGRPPGRSRGTQRLAMVNG
jgi:hypothetical protein